MIERLTRILQRATAGDDTGTNRRPASLVEVLERVIGVILHTPKPSDRKSRVRISTDGGPDLFA